MLNPKHVSSKLPRTLRDVVLAAVVRLGMQHLSRQDRPPRAGNGDEEIYSFEIQLITVLGEGRADLPQGLTTSSFYVFPRRAPQGAETFHTRTHVSVSGTPHT